MRRVLSADRKKNVEIVAEVLDLSVVNPDCRNTGRGVGNGMPLFVENKAHQREYGFAEDS